MEGAGGHVRSRHCCVECFHATKRTGDCHLAETVQRQESRQGLVEHQFPCMMACPAHTNAGRYVALIAEGRFEEAYKFARDPNPLASICGRVCAHPCETACRRGDIDRPIAIRALKRFLTERHGPESKRPVDINAGRGRANCPSKSQWSAAGQWDSRRRTTWLSWATPSRFSKLLRSPAECFTSAFPNTACLATWWKRKCEKFSRPATLLSSSIRRPDATSRFPIAPPGLRCGADRRGRASQPRSHHSRS
jgi:hypothetical protein